MNQTALTDTTAHYLLKIYTLLKSAHEFLGNGKHICREGNVDWAIFLKIKITAKWIETARNGNRKKLSGWDGKERPISFGQMQRFLFFQSRKSVGGWKLYFCFFVSRLARVWADGGFLCRPEPVVSEDTADEIAGRRHGFGGRFLVRLHG